MIDITELHAISQSQLADILALMKEPDSEVDANNLCRSLGFQPKETNVYKMPIKR